MAIAMLKERLKSYGIDVRPIVSGLRKNSLKNALNENGLKQLSEKLRRIVPDEDIAGQEFSEDTSTDCARLKRRALQAFQCSLMLKALEMMPSGDLTVVDIGDSAGTHMLYLKELVKDRFNVNTVSVNLDSRAVEKINARGLKAILCRAEELDLGDEQVDLFTSFQMVEHLHNPSVFFRRLAKKSKGNRMVLTVPYLKKSRVGLHHIRNRFCRPITAEEEHIFELSPEDWTLLMLHSGWRVVYSKVYYQYPRKWPLLNRLWGLFWSITDFEGFWGAILEKDTTYSDYYQDWEE